jgi:DNA-binding XRE family transcriptional regulator
MISGRGELRQVRASPRRLGVVSGFLFKLIRESTGLTQVQLAEQFGVDTASVQGWESGRRPLASLRVADFVQLRAHMLRRGAHPTLLATLDDAIQADLIIAETVQADHRTIGAVEHPLGATVHQCRLSSLITWPFTGIAPTLPRDLMTLRVRRGPVPDQPKLTLEDQTGFFDHLLLITDTKSHEGSALARRQAIYLLGFDTRASTVEWLRSEYVRALRGAKNIDQVPTWVVVRSSAVALAYGGDRDPLRTFLRHTVATDRLEQANLNYWAYWTGELDGVEADDTFMSRINPQDWSGARLLGQLLELLRPGSGHAELDLHTVWTLLLAHPGLLSQHPDLGAATARTVDHLASDPELSVQSRRELSDIYYAARLAHR